MAEGTLTIALISDVFFDVDGPDRLRRRLQAGVRTNVNPKRGRRGTGRAALLLVCLPFGAGCDEPRVWAPAQIIGDLASPESTRPRIATDVSGSALAIWGGYDPRRLAFSVSANRFALGAGWGQPETIAAGSARGLGAADIAVDLRGNAVAVWCTSEGAQLRIWAHRYVVGAGWSSAQTVGLHDSSRIFVTLPPRVAMNAASEALAVWRNEAEGGVQEIWASRFEPNAGWGVPERIGSEAGGGSGAEVTIDPNGNGFATWRAWDGRRENIWANRFVKGSGWGRAQVAPRGRSGLATWPWIVRGTHSPCGTRKQTASLARGGLG